MPNIRWLLALITTVHRLLYRATNGRIGGTSGGMKILLLTTVGRTTGRGRVNPLLYVGDGDRWAIVASNAGDDRHPAWWLNLRDHPNAEIQVGADRTAVRARESTPQESERLWPVLTASYRYYADYRKRTQRAIPIVILEPRSSETATARP